MACTTSTSFASWRTTWSRSAGAPRQVIVMREKRLSTTGLTTRLSMLKPRREKTRATRTSTPGLLLTKQEIVWIGWSEGSRTTGAAALISGAPLGLREPVARLLDQHLGDGGPRRDHREDVVLLHDLGHHHAGPLVVLVRLAQDAVDVGGAADAQRLGPVGLRQLHEVRVALEVGPREPVVVEHLLPLADHAQVVVVDDQHLDPAAVQLRRRELGHRHLEAAVADDRPHLEVRVGEARPDRRREAEAHRPGPAAREPVAVAAGAAELRGPHLVLTDVRGEDGVALRHRVEAVEHVLRAEPALLRVAERVLA